MIRPCFLVIETALLNVITPCSAEEAIATLTRFPAVDGAVLDTEVRGNELPRSD